jgi:hypothetical protein
MSPIAGYSSNQSEACLEKHLSSCTDIEKIYIEPNQLVFMNNEMWAYVKGTWVSISALFSDTHGLYIHNYPYTRWICKICGYNNYGGDTTCQNRDQMTKKYCHAPRPE